jgi:branched-chain amino acid transport system substrate-binding protein
MGETDFQAEISKARAAKPQAVFYFGPGAMGIAFIKQWEASGAGKDIKLYTHYVVDSITLPAIGEAALGSFQISSYPIDGTGEVNQRFVKDYVAKHAHLPSVFAAQAYDAPRLLGAALKKTNGKFDDPIAFMKVLRHTPYPSSRGYFPYNVNGLPIIDFYKIEIARGGDGKPQMATRGTIVKGSKDPYWQECPEQNRL